MLSLAQLDCLLSLATVARRPKYVKPTFSEHTQIKVTNGRHPMVEQFLSDSYVANDVDFDVSFTCMTILMIMCVKVFFFLCSRMISAQWSWQGLTWEVGIGSYQKRRYTEMIFDDRQELIYSASGIDSHHGANRFLRSCWFCTPWYFGCCIH